MDEPAAGLGGNGPSSGDGGRGQVPGVRSAGPAGSGTGWGSPVPAGYGSLRTGSSGFANTDRETAPSGRSMRPALSPRREPRAELRSEPEAPTTLMSRRGPVEVRRTTLSHISIVTVIKVSVVLYLVFLAVIVVAAMLLWVVADQTGVVTSIDKSVRSLFSLKAFALHASAVAKYTALAGGVLGLAGTLANILAALIYNLIADVVGGIRLRTESTVLE